jgi:hypothetical protein
MLPVEWSECPSQCLPFDLPAGADGRAIRRIGPELADKKKNGAGF